MTENMEKNCTVAITGPALAEPAMEKLGEKCRTVNIKPYTPSEEIAAIVRKNQADALIVRMGRIDAHVIGASKRLKVITKHGTGVDNIDLAAATRAKLPVMITPYSNFESVAEHVLGLMIAVARETVLLDRRMREGRWAKSSNRGVELFEKTLGIVGFGRIGRRLRELVRPLRMPVVVYDPVSGPPEPLAEVIVAKTLDELLGAADFVSLNCPLTPETTNLIGACELNRMKKTAWLINTARGGIVDEVALFTALKNKEIAGAALDTFAQEPPKEIHPLAELDNVVLTPHIGGVTAESFVRMGMQAVKNVLDFLEGRPPDLACVLNPEVL